MRNGWPVLLLLLAACRKDEPETSKVVKHDAAPAPSPVDDTAAVDPIAETGPGCTDDATCTARCALRFSRACRELARGDVARACAEGDGLSCFEAAVAAPADQRAALETTARETMTRSCDAGDAMACHDLAHLDRHGLLDRRDVAGAQVLDRRACELGLAQGCFETFDVERALAIHLTACDRGDVEACAGAMAPAEQINAERAARVKRRVVPVLARACETDPDACYQGALVADDASVITKLWARADAQWTAACDGGDREACVELATVLAPGVDDAPPPQLDRHRDPFRGRKLWQRACALDPEDELSCEAAKGSHP